MEEPKRGVRDDTNFQEAVRQARRVDPLPTLRNLAASTGTELEDVVHYALVRYASAGAEALLAIAPPVLSELIAARKAGDWQKVGALVDWLAAGLESEGWR